MFVYKSIFLPPVLPLFIYDGAKKLQHALIDQRVHTAETLF